MTLHLTLCSISLLYWEAQNWTHQMQPHQRWESREHLLQPAGNTLPNTAEEAVCHLCHGTALLAHRWLPTSTSSYFSAELSPSRSAPQCYFIPDAGFCNSLCCTLKSRSAQISSLAASLWTQTQPWGIWGTPLFCTIWELAGGTVSQHSGHYWRC